jgi:arylsulfatase
VFTKLAWDYPQLLPDRYTSSTPAEVYGDLFLDWQAEQSGSWAATINFMDTHLPYLPDSEYNRWGGNDLLSLQNDMDDQVWEFNGGQRPWWQRRALEGVYDGTIRQIDSQIERIVKELKNRGSLDDTLLVVTSDHGEGFGEASHIRPGARLAGHGQGIHEVLVHVPLVVKCPRQTISRRVEDPATLTQFPDAVRAAIDDREPTFIPDKPVIVHSDGLEEPMKERASEYCEDISRFDGKASAIYTGSGTNVQKTIRWNERSVNVTIRDAKTCYIADNQKESRVTDRLNELIDMNVRTDTEDIDQIDNMTRQRLEDLGYV